MSRMKDAILLFSFFIGLHINAQDNSDSFLTEAELNSVTDKIHTLFLSDSSTFFIDISQVPDAVWMFIIKHNDSLEGKPWHGERREADIVIDRFIANYDEDYDGTDVITGLPERKFVFGIKDSNDLFFYYFHGGRGNHLHLVYVDLINNQYSAFATLNNWIAIRKREGETRITKWRKVLRMPLVSERYVKVINNSLYEDYDVF